MSKIIRHQINLSSLISDVTIFISGMLCTLIITWYFPTTLVRNQNQVPSISPYVIHENNVMNQTTFYDDSELSYQMGSPIKEWDLKRQQWLTTHSTFIRSGEQVVMVTGSQPKQCEHPNGDHLLLRLFKNKVDYCRIHGHDIFYNNVLLHKGMSGFWAKYPLVKSTMLAHPEAEWVWWVDSDAVFTDMDFSLPLNKYKDHNLVVYGWPEVIYEKKSAMGLNAGVFLIRNCQWSMDLLDRWASFGPQTDEYVKWGQVQQSMFYDKTDNKSDDQTALTYMLLVEKEKWGDKIYLESEYYFQGYWVDIVGKFANVTRHYKDIQRRIGPLRAKHAEKAGGKYRAQWRRYLDRVNTGGFGVGGWRRPFVTHFTGCEPCSGEHNPMYTSQSCEDGMVTALNFADDQVLRNLGYTRRDLSNSSSVEIL